MTNFDNRLQKKSSKAVKLFQCETGEDDQEDEDEGSKARQTAKSKPNKRDPHFNSKDWLRARARLGVLAS